MKKVKVSEISSVALDWLVDTCEGNSWEDPLTFLAYWEESEGLAYSLDWNHGGPIIEREVSKIFKNIGGTYTAQMRHEETHPQVSHKVLTGFTNASGHTLLIAAMRCYVISKLGEVVEVPKELL